MMTEEPDPLEAQLHKLKPQPMSAELRGRIAGRISASARARARILRGSLVALAAVLLVSVTVVVAVRGPGPQTEGTKGVVGPALPAGESVRIPERPAEPALRLLAARHLAEAETIDQVDAVLDQYAPRWLVFTDKDRGVLFAPGL